MSSIDSVAQKYRGLYLTAIAQGLEQMLDQAEANAVSYLHFAETLIEQELQLRNGKRTLQNQRRAGFPVQKSLDDFDYVFQTTISKREVNRAPLKVCWFFLARGRAAPRLPRTPFQ